VDTNRIVAELRAERDRLDKAIMALTAGSVYSRSGRTPTRPLGRSRRRMSLAARKRLSQMLKQRWASGKMGRRKAKAA